MSIRIFITGGTFDKEYNELNGQLYFKDTHLSDLLEMGRSRVAVEIRTLMMVDSLEMTEEEMNDFINAEIKAYREEERQKLEKP